MSKISFNQESCEQWLNAFANKAASIEQLLEYADTLKEPKAIRDSANLCLKMHSRRLMSLNDASPEWSERYWRAVDIIQERLNQEP